MENTGTRRNRRRRGRHPAVAGPTRIFNQLDTGRRNGNAPDRPARVGFTDLPYIPDTAILDRLPTGDPQRRLQLGEEALSALLAPGINPPLAVLDDLRYRVAALRMHLRRTGRDSR